MSEEKEDSNAEVQKQLEDNEKLLNFQEQKVLKQAEQENNSIDTAKLLNNDQENKTTPEADLQKKKCCRGSGSEFNKGYK